MNTSGIYQIQSKVKPERVYIGSAINIHARWIRHKWELKKGVHPCSKMQRHYNKYGKDDLQYSVLIGCEKNDLIVTEQFYLDSFGTYFNTCKRAGSVLGIKRSDETKFKIGNANRGRITNIGRVVSEETRAKISKSLLGSKNGLGHRLSEEQKKEIGDRQRGALSPNYGKRLSEETRKKMSEFQRGKIISDEAKQNMRTAWILRKSKQTITN